MSVTEAFSGSEAVTTTEWSLVTDTAGPDTSTAAGEYQCFLDLSAMLLGDTFEFRVSEKVTSGGTQRVCLLATFSNAQGTDGANWVSPKLMLLNGWDMTLLKTAGTDRTITWSIRQNDVTAANIRTAVGLATANLDTQIDALPTAAELATALGTADDAVLTAVAAVPAALLDAAAGVETGVTVRQFFRLAAAALFGKASGMATTTVTFRNVPDDKDRIVATVDTDGNRTAVTLDAS